MTTTVSEVPLYTGIAPNRLNQQQTEFSANSDDISAYQAEIADYMNTSIGEMNQLGSEVTALAQDADASATSAAQDALISQSNSNFKGKWDDATGASTVPASYWHNGANWQMLVDIADITLSEPSADNDDWSVIITPALSEPDVKISFNDGITMERGYGTVDGNGNRAIDYTRASAISAHSKSGVSQALAINEPIIKSGGIGAYDSFTNSLLHSGDLGNAAWTTAGNPPTQDGTLSSDGVNQAWMLENSRDNTTQQNVTGLPLNGECVLCYMEVKAGTSNIARVRWLETNSGTTKSVAAEIDLTTGIVSQATHDYISVERLNDGWWGVWYSNETTNTGNTILRMLVGNAESSGENTIYVSKCMVIDDAKCTVPYIETTVSPASSGPDVATVPLAGNIPPPGLPFSIACDCSIDAFTAEKNAFRNGSPTSGFVLRRIATGGVVASISNGTEFIDASGSVDDKVHRLTFVYNGLGILLYSDGALLATTPVSTVVYNVSTDLHIGKSTTGAGHLNSEIKNFEIFHKALSSEEIAARGGPK